MVRRVAILLALTVALTAALARADERPTFTSLPGALGIHLPPSLLQNAEVQRQLGTGLTTTFVVIARLADGSVSGAKIEVRYDLWDEVYLIRRTEFDQHVDQQRIASRADLERWWRTTPLRLAAAPGGDRVRLQIDLTVLPFSAAEQQDARQWLSKSGGLASPGAAGGGRGLVDALIGTTISARPLLTFRWNIDLALK